MYHRFQHIYKEGSKKMVANSSTLLYFALSTVNCVGSLIAGNVESVAPSLFYKLN